MMESTSMEVTGIFFKTLFNEMGLETAIISESCEIEETLSKDLLQMENYKTVNQSSAIGLMGHFN